MEGDRRGGKWEWSASVMLADYRPACNFYPLDKAPTPQGSMRYRNELQRRKSLFSSVRSLRPIKTLFRILILCLTVTTVGFGILAISRYVGNAQPDSAQGSSSTVQRRTLEDRVVERGTV